MTSSDESQQEDRAQKRLRLEQLQVVREVALDFAAASSFHSRGQIQSAPIKFGEHWHLPFSQSAAISAQDQTAAVENNGTATQEQALPNFRQVQVSCEHQEHSMDDEALHFVDTSRPHKDMRPRRNLIDMSRPYPFPIKETAQGRDRMSSRFPVVSPGFCLPVKTPERIQSAPVSDHGENSSQPDIIDLILSPEAESSDYTDLEDTESSIQSHEEEDSSQ
ncbi:hypothetical protein, conserved [Eimeria tenella]|uniref:Uncharacterized protein n=1 Tax=Eimeria tenella TaxID=5802 RepID=U6KUB7_EIMTE|nr:hypothetical protein, conserved [Eimeria tenella]CDJ40503.1 hypothetical protein, conserved [Eimeria tenella]|eukprot:XP_013231253.1 hypothetical protein, conserved [Eimeria tenella]